MAGYLWEFTVTPSTIDTVTLSSGYIEETLQGVANSFSTSSFAEGNTVTVTATGYLPATAEVGDANITLTEEPSTITCTRDTTQDVAGRASLIDATTLYNITDDNVVRTSALTSYQLIAQPLTTLSTSGTIALSDNTINSITPTGNITFTLPTVTDDTTFHQILVQVHLSTVYTITLGTSYYFNKTAPDLSATGEYNLVFEYDKANQYWVVGAMPKGSAS